MNVSGTCDFLARNEDEIGLGVLGKIHFGWININVVLAQYEEVVAVVMIPFRDRFRARIGMAAQNRVSMGVAFVPLGLAANLGG
ncbi:MAG: hypothetical protein CL790_04380 [Chloroflexi bacterium]|nr:hypothetical protein [Chloroflexota bacterium]